MKQKGRNIIVIFLALIVFYVGAGVTVIDLCCSNCVENLFSATPHHDTDCGDMSEEKTVNPHSCCSNDKDSGMLPCTNEHEGKCCEAERISLDIDHRIYKPDLSQNNESYIITHCFCCCFCHTTDIGYNEFLADTEYLNPLHPREYLSIIRVLII